MRSNWTSWKSGSADRDELQLNVNESLTVFTGKDATSQGPAFKFREQFWSARWTGLIKPQFAEPYTFSLDVDGSSDVMLRIGGEGAGYDGRRPGTVIINITATGSGVPRGVYNFSDMSPKEIVVEYAHYMDDAHLRLLWQSPSTPLSIVPDSAFLHWRNATHYNLTVHPSDLSAKHSTAFGGGLHNATVGVPQWFVVYGRDAYGNLRQTGGDVPSMVAVGPDGVTFRGDVTDYKNSTYLIEYYPVAAGEYRMYVTVGCCPPHPNVGLSAEIATFEEEQLLVNGGPFLLIVSPAAPKLSETIAIGDGLLSSTAGSYSTFRCLYRDLHKNPTYDLSSSGVNVTVSFVDKSSGVEIVSDDVIVMFFEDGSGFNVTYNLTRAGDYLMSVSVISADADTSDSSVEVPIVGSPYAITVSPSVASSVNTVCRGAYLRQAVKGHKYSFEIQARDSYNNLLTVGGSKFLVRVTGGDVADGDPNYVPSCTDQLNGKYLCSYTASRSGQHHINVMLLSNTLDGEAAVNSVGGVGLRPGGSGLVGNYHASSDPLNPHSNSAPILTTIDKSLSFSWPSGVIFPTSNNAADISSRINASVNSGTIPAIVPAAEDLSAIAGGRLPLTLEGQSVLWTGYLVSPRSDRFAIFARTNHFDATIYIDSKLVFDSSTGLQSSIQLVAEASYALVIVGRSTRSALANSPTSPALFNLMWSTPTIKPSSISSFFLYPFAQHVAQSPYPVEVKDE
jgi:hypothetical protein